MPRRSRPGPLDERLVELQELLANFERELLTDDLRVRVLALVPVHRALADLGSSLVPRNVAASGADRILHYFLKYPQTIISGEEVMVIAGIDDWSRRLRQLRVEQGWSILSGETAKIMVAEGDLPGNLDGQNLRAMKVNDYLLTTERQDRDAAFRWKAANGIRKESGAVKSKILKYLRANVGKEITGEELRYVANNRSEWARRTRELRTEDGWPVVTKHTGMPNLPVGVYVLQADRRNPEHSRSIPDRVRLEVLQRDNFTCIDCKWTRDNWRPEVPRFLELHHLKAHAEMGENTAENLVTLCNSCHDERHRK